MMDAVIAVLVQALAPLAGTLLSALVSWAVFEVTRFVRQRIKSEAAAAAIAQIGSIVDTVVAELSQTTVDELKRATASGKLDRAGAAKVKRLALQKIDHLVPAATAKAAELAVNSLSHWIDSRIEQAVYASKFPVIEAVSGEFEKGE